MPTNDAAEYDGHAVSIATTGSYHSSVLIGGPSAFRPPAFPVLLAGVYKIVGVGSATVRWEAGRIAEAILGVIAVGLICVIARRLWGPSVALLAGLIAAVYPPLLLVGSSLMSEPLFIVVTLGAVLAAMIHRDSRHTLRYALLAGLLCGVAALTRGNGFFVALPVAFLVWSERPRFSLAALRAPLVVLATTVLTLVPWAIRNSSVFGEFVPLGTETGYALEGTYNSAARHDQRYPWLWMPPLAEALTLHAQQPSLNEADISNRLTSRALRYVRAHPVAPLEVAFWNTVRMLNLSGTGLERFMAGVWDYGRGLATWSVYSFWLLALLAIVGAFTRAARRAPLAFWGAPLALAVPSLFFLGLTRYRSPADPYLVMLAALGILSVAGRLRAWHAARGG